MEFFSTRNRVISTNPNGLRSTSMELRERIWNVFYKVEYALGMIVVGWLFTALIIKAYPPESCSDFL